MSNVFRRAVRSAPALRVGNAALASLGTHPLASRFHAWLGGSNRRYVVSIYAVDPLADDAGLPGFEAFVLIPVARDGANRRPLGILAIERESDRRRAIVQTGAADEWHVHLLAGDRRERAAIVADLSARHGFMGAEALSA